MSSFPREKQFFVNLVISDFGSDKQNLVIPVRTALTTVAYWQLEKCGQGFWNLQTALWNEYVTFAVESQFKQLRSTPKKVFRGFNGIRTRGLCVRRFLQIRRPSIPHRRRSPLRLGRGVWVSRKHHPCRRCRPRPPPPFLLRHVWCSGMGNQAFKTFKAMSSFPREKQFFVNLVISDFDSDKQNLVIPVRTALTTVAYWQLEKCGQGFWNLQTALWNEYVTFAVESQFKQLRSTPKKVFRGFNAIRTRGLCVRAAVLYRLSYEDPYNGK